MLSPCNCSGTLSNVHVECLRQWRQQFPSHDRRAQFCQQCLAPYDHQYALPAGYYEKRRARGSLLVWGAWGTSVVVLLFGWGGVDQDMDAAVTAVCGAVSMVLFGGSVSLLGAWKRWMVVPFGAGTILLALLAWYTVRSAEHILQAWQFLAFPVLVGLGTSRNVRTALAGPPPDNAFLVME